MHLERVVCREVFQFHHLELDFSPRLTAIVGPVGVGKSNSMRAAGLGLTNQCPGFPGNRAQAICQLAPPGSRSSIEVRVAHHGAKGVLTRHLDTGKRSLSWGGEVLTKEADVAQVVESWLGLPLDLVHDYIFIDQHQLFSFLACRPQERLKALNRLFRLERAEVIWEQLGKRLATLGPSVELDVAAVENRVNVLRIRLTETEAELAAFPAPSPEVVQEAEAVLDRWRESQTARADLARVVAERERLAARLAGVEAELGVVVGALEPLQAVDDQARRADLERSLQGLQRQRDLATRSAKVERACQEAHEEALALPPLGDRPPWSDEDERALTLLEGESRAVGMVVELVAAAKPGGRCPTCGTPASLLTQSQAEYTVRWRHLEGQHSALVERRRVFLSYQDEERRRQRLWERGANLAAQRAALEELGAGPAPDPGAEAALRDEAQTLCEVAKAVQALLPEQARLQHAQAHSQGVLVGVVARLSELQSRLDLLETVGDLTASQRLLDEARRVGLLQAGLDARRAEVQASLTQAELELAQAQEQARVQSCRRAWRSELEQQRAVFRRDALPAVTAQAHLESLEDDLNQNLELLGAEFRAAVGEGLSFRCFFPDGRDVPAEWLSGGEKVVFALSWRLAVNGRFAADVGLLVLDEPTQGFDGDVLACFHAALKRARTLAEGTGLQLVVVTHDRSSLPLFDTVIEITPR
jgi:DNA repair exonuclease SbcCD ATPase subunit